MLLNNFELEDKDLKSSFCVCEEKEKDIVELRQPMKLPSSLICNILPVTKNGEKQHVRLKLQELIGVHDLLGRRHTYKLSAFITHYGIDAKEGHFNCTVLRNKRWFLIDDKLVKPQQLCETIFNGDVYMLFYSTEEHFEVQIMTDESTSISEQDQIKDKMEVTTPPSPPECVQDSTLTEKVDRYWDLRKGHQLHHIVSHINGTPLMYYDIKLLDQAPSDYEKTLLEQYATKHGETYNEGWLNDKIINNFLIDVQRKSQGTNRVAVMSSFMYTKLCKYGVHSITKWIQKNPFFKADLCFIPINLDNNHWSLGVVDFTSCTIFLYDPMAMAMLREERSFHKKIRLLIAHLQAICPEMSPPDVKYFDNSTKFEPRQLDGSSCGVFVCMVADYMVNGLDVNFTQVIISKYNFW
ncbi:uncharacterized protein LOC114541847 isoform X1 [Dendronephthya gigantea]|uniref:uncharacterized protein LOC114541847 isoform X1 n=1 Tax=Dendronephthya gigantea TaxID=151771 RepID=UPI00106C9E74|nr:uncharacterized protein LOC114541847 isoform X1 [Dendronephthya gigantea]